MLIAELGPQARLLNGEEDATLLPVRSASVLTATTGTTDCAAVLVCPPLISRDELTKAVRALDGGPARILVLTAPCPVPAAEAAALAGDHLLVEAGGTIDPAEAVLAIGRVCGRPEENMARRLASLQRSLTQTLGSSTPLPDLLARLKSTCNATVALVDKRGQALHSTGPAPLTLLVDTVRRTDAETQFLDVDGWTGVADRVRDPDVPGDYLGWLVVVNRRGDFADPYLVSAVHVAASLVEVCHQMTQVSRRQENAVRAAVLEEALALEPFPDDPELTGRIAGLGLDFGHEIRTIVLRPVRSSLTSRGVPVLRQAADGLEQALKDANVPFLLSVRDRQLVAAVQCSPSTLKRLISGADGSIPDAYIGVGRDARSTGELARSLHDAQLAVHTLLRDERGRRVLTYDDFDFATWLFSDVGVDRLIDWAREFLRPLADRPPMIEGLRAYFEHKQSMNGAARSLNIHHNSLRYRLAKVEETLDISLRDPAATASVFLALTALDLARAPRTRLQSPRFDEGCRPTDIDAPQQPVGEASPHSGGLGVVFDPDRA
ncbi:helix-turn-helix domain-containing protein [Streptomyces sp. NPDC000151]|uniref:PucR family transcriptional regulator n=1 Tax=Streptomyces sp. NPDC000151 TaxID=3154244 RepID=UPI00331B65EF